MDKRRIRICGWIANGIGQRQKDRRDRRPVAADARYGRYDPSGEVDIAPLGLEELDDLEQQLMRRRQVAASAVNDSPPQAKPSIENCRHCEVRQLCDVYWNSATQQDLAKERAKQMSLAQDRLHDLEVEVIARRGVSSWDVLVTVSGLAAKNTRMILVASQTDVVLRSVLDQGGRIRVLGARALEQDQDSNAPLMSLGVSSEAFIV